MINLILLGIIVLLCLAILYAHKTHTDALTALRSELTTLRVWIRERLKGEKS